MRLCSEWESDRHNCKKDRLLFPTWCFFPHWDSFPILKVCIITAGSRGATWMCVVSFFNFVSLLHYRIHRAIKNTGFDLKLTLKHI